MLAVEFLTGVTHENPGRIPASGCMPFIYPKWATIAPGKLPKLKQGRRMMHG